MAKTLKPKPFNPFVGKIPIYPEYEVKKEAKIRYKKFIEDTALGGFREIEQKNNVNFIIYDVDFSVVDVGDNTTFLIDDGTTTTPPTAQIIEFGLGTSKTFHWHSDIGLVLKERIRIYVSTLNDYNITINGEIVNI